MTHSIMTLIQSIFFSMVAINSLFYTKLSGSQPFDTVLIVFFFCWIGLGFMLSVISFFSRNHASIVEEHLKIRENIKLSQVHPDPETISQTEKINDDEEEKKEREPETAQINSKKKFKFFRSEFANMPKRLDADKELPSIQTSGLRKFGLNFRRLKPLPNLELGSPKGGSSGRSFQSEFKQNSPSEGKTRSTPSSINTPSRLSSFFKS